MQLFRKSVLLNVPEQVEAGQDKRGTQTEKVNDTGFGHAYNLVLL